MKWLQAIVNAESYIQTIYENIMYDRLVSFINKWKAQEQNSPRFLQCDEGCAFGIAILLYIDKGVPVLSAGVQLSRCKFGYTTICHLPSMRIAKQAIFLVSVSHVYEQYGFEVHI